MPRGNRSGPAGAGPMSGRGAGFCRGNDLPGYLDTAGCRLTEYGRRCTGTGGRGRGFRNWFNATGIPGWLRFYHTSVNSKEYKIEILNNQAEYLTKALEDIKVRISKISNEG